jgi:hypothetical protein
MGTRYEDQPAEHWAGAESLDPTPVWKQYILIALLLFGGLIAVVVVSLLAIAPQIVTPPALVPGDRLVLSVYSVPPVGAGPRLIGAPLVDDTRSFYLVQPERGRVLAFRARWAEAQGAPECRISPAPLRPTPQQFLASDCASASGPKGSPLFDYSGISTNGFRGLDQYLVSVSDDRVIVNLSRLIEASERTGGPVPTGIPQPQTP